MYTSKQKQELNTLTEQLLKKQFEKIFDAEEAAIVIKELKQVIAYHDWLYYVQTTNEINDISYDYLFESLKYVEEQFPELKTSDSPTQRLTNVLSNNFQSVVHTIPMLSLNKAYSNADVEDWTTAVLKIIGLQTLEGFWLDPKLDGSSIAIIYENDVLVRGATRGNGIEGEDITANIKQLNSIPLVANFSKYGISKVELRGEAIIPKQRFKSINKNREQNNEKILANPRNAAAGALRLKDASRVAERGLDALIYHIASATDSNGNDVLVSEIQSHQKSMQMLYQLGFKTLLQSSDDNTSFCKTLPDVLLNCQQWKNNREQYPYEIDGIVIKINDLQIQQLCGETAHHPRWAIAFKFDAKQAETILENVDFQVGRTGSITPVAKLQKQLVAGVEISNASLHNEDFIAEKDIRIGDTVVVERAGDVIPYIVRVITEKRTGKEQIIQFPSHCPSCQSNLQKPEGEAKWRCFNADCPAQIEEHLIHFASKDAMDIRGLGKDIIKRFYQLGFLHSIEDIYRLDFKKIIELDRWAAKSVENLINSIETSKNQPLYRLLIGLGIREVGESTAKVLANSVQNIEDFYTWDIEKYTEIPDIGPKMAANISAFFEQNRNREIISNLKLFGINTTNRLSDKQLISNIFLGKTFLFTGSLQQLSREKAENLVQLHGGKIISAVSSKLNYLVVGEKAGSKLAKAQKTPEVSIIDEQTFLSMVP